MTDSEIDYVLTSSPPAPLEYSSDPAATWRTVTRWAAVATMLAALLRVLTISNYLVSRTFARTQAFRQELGDWQGVFGMTVHITCLIACGTALLAAWSVTHAKRNGADWWLRSSLVVWIASARLLPVVMVGYVLLSGSLRRVYSGAEFWTYLLSSAVSCASAVFVPSILLWLFTRPPIRDVIGG